MIEAEQSKVKLSNTELVKRCANSLNNNSAWLEFFSRYKQCIYYTIIHECQKNEVKKYCFQFEETVKDLVQDVYLKILENDCKALKQFRGESENSVYSYLKMIAKNVVKNYITKMQAQKRPQVEISLDTPIMLTDENEPIYYKDRKKSTSFDTEQEFRLTILKEEIEYRLAKLLTGRKKKRNKLICQLHIYNGFSANEIALFFNFGISTKHIANIISNSRQKLIKTLSLVKQHENTTG